MAIASLVKENMCLLHIRTVIRTINSESNPLNVLKSIRALIQSLQGQQHNMQPPATRVEEYAKV